MLFDPAKELAKQYPTKQELAIQVLTRMNLLCRNQRDAWYPEDATHSPEHWLQQLFAGVNNCRNAEFTLPQTIEVVVPDDVFESDELPLRIIDTKGIDQTAERRDFGMPLRRSTDPRRSVQPIQRLARGSYSDATPPGKRQRGSGC